MQDIEDIIKETLENLLKKLEIEYTKITVEKDEDESYKINVESENPSMLIGYHGLNVQAIQHILKVLCWKKTEHTMYNIFLDIDNYRKRQEENIIALAERKIESVRQNGRPQHLPPMSAYFRRQIHTLCMNPGYEDVETVSQGEEDRRHIIIKLKN